MKLNMSIFTDWLKPFSPKADLKSDLLEIETVRLFSRDMQLQDNTLYVGRIRDFFKNGNSHVLCTHKNDILLLDTDDLESVINCLLNAYEFYSGWNSDMLEMLATGAMMQDLLDRSEDILGHPLFLLDAGQRMIAYSRGHDISQIDELWKQMVETGSANLSFLMEINRTHPERTQIRELYTLGGDPFPHRSWHQNFFFRDQWISSATLIDTDNTMTRGALSLFSIFCMYADRWFQSHIQTQNTLQQDYLLQAAIADANADDSELKHRLLIHGWKDSDSLMFIRMSAAFQPFNINLHLCRTLNYSFPSLHAVPSGLSICVLCNLTQKDWPTLQAELLPWMKASKYYGVLSATFSLSDSFYQNYQSTAWTDAHCDREPGQFYHSGPYLLKYVFQEMNRLISLDIRHPALRRLEEYDAKHQTDFARTLYLYLQNERNHAKTASALNLHRNSLSYRLKRLEQLLGVDLNDPLVRLHLLISYEIDP